MKTAGTTFVQSLREQFPGAAIYPSRGTDWDSPTDVEAYLSIDRLLGLDAARTEQICIYTGHFPYMVRDLIDPSLLTLTLLRDPVERTISVLKQFKRLEERCREPDARSDLRRRAALSLLRREPPDQGLRAHAHDEVRTIMRPITIDDARFGWRSRTWPPSTCSVSPSATTSSSRSSGADSAGGPTAGPVPTGRT